MRLTATYQASTGRMALCLNDVAAAQATHTSTWNATGSLTTGAYLYNDAIPGHFWGNISDVETYAQALTAKQVAVLAGKPRILQPRPHQRRPRLQRRRQRRRRRPVG